MAYQLQEINRRIQTDVTAFLTECDENYAQRVSLGGRQGSWAIWSTAPSCFCPGPPGPARPPLP